MKEEYIVEGGMVIISVVNCVVNLGLPLQFLDLNIMWGWVLMNGVKKLSLWRPCWRFLWR